jgi:hypothetical protein
MIRWVARFALYMGIACILLWYVLEGPKHGAW